MAILEKTLKDLKKNQDLAIFMRERVRSDTVWGFLRDYNQYCFLIDVVNSDGIYEGISVFQRPQISRIRWGTSNLASVSELYTKKNKHVTKPKISIDSMHSVLRDVQAAYGYISVSIEDLDEDALCLGEIHSLDETHVVIHEFSNKTAKDRSYLLCPLDEISGIHAGAVYEEDIRYLNKEFWDKPRKKTKT